MNQTLHFPALTGIRALAAYLVFIHHFNPVAEVRAPFLHHLFNELHIGVSIFFVLSGFLITIRYENKLQTSGNILHYFGQRFARIYPLYFILTTVTLLVAWWRNSWNSFHWDEYFLNISFLKGCFDQWKFSGIAQGWSLTVEVCFYLAAPLIFMLTSRSKQGWWLVAIPIALTVGIYFWVNGFFSSWAMKDVSFVLIYTFAGRCIEFFVGVELARFVLTKNTQATKRQMRFTRVGILWMAVCIFIMATLAQGGSSSLDSPWGLLLNNVVFPIGVALLLLGLIWETTWMSKLLSNRLVLVLGQSSYAFYLIHLGVFQQALQGLVPNTIVLFIALNGLAVAFFLWIERPLHKYVERHWILAKEQKATR